MRAAKTVQTGRIPRLMFRWVHSHFVGFAMWRLIFLLQEKTMTRFQESARIKDRSRLLAVVHYGNFSVFIR